MPCSPAEARRLLNDGKAKVLRRTPFTLKLLYGSSGYKQPVVAGMDTGTHTLLYLKRHVSAGDYQQTMGRHSQIRLPTGKLFGLRKHDLVRTEKGTGWVKGKRSTGFFALETIDGQTLTPSVNVKKATTRLAARTTTLIQRKDGDRSPL